MRAMSSASTSSLSSRSVVSDSLLGERLLLLPEPLLELDLAAVPELRHPGVVRRPFGGLDLDLERLQLGLGLAQAADGALLLLPAALERRGALGDVRELALERLEPGPRRVVLLLAQRLALDLQLDAASLQLVELDGHRVHLHAQPAGRLVDEVDGLVGQEAVGDVAVGQDRGRDQRGVGDAHAVVHLVALAQAAQDGDGLLHGGLVHVHRLEAPLQRGVLLDVLAVLVERRRADGVQLTAREHRLEQVGGVHGAFGGARAHDGVQLVDEQDDLALGVLDLLEHGLEPLLELAAVLGTRDERAQVERDDLAVLEALGHVAADDALGEALGDGGLAHARLADEHRVVLGAAAEHLDDAPDLLVAADDRVELAGPRVARSGRGRSFSSAW